MEIIKSYMISNEVIGHGKKPDRYIRRKIHFINVLSRSDVIGALVVGYICNIKSQCHKFYRSLK